MAARAALTFRTTSLQIARLRVATLLRAIIIATRSSAYKRVAVAIIKGVRRGGVGREGAEGEVVLGLLAIVVEDEQVAVRVRHPVHEACSACPALHTTW